MDEKGFVFGFEGMETAEAWRRVQRKQGQKETRCFHADIRAVRRLGLDICRER